MRTATGIIAALFCGLIAGRLSQAAELAELPLARRMALDMLVLKALAKRASDRHRSARELAEIIHRLLH